MPDPVIIEDYDPRWPQLFAMLRSRILAVLDDLALSIEHVGSTAVPGLAAKPIIDIDVLLRPSAELPVVIAKLGDLGYEHRGDLGVTGREAFRAKSDDVHHHLYVCPSGSREYERHIAFRDYLRTHPVDANAYGLLKRQLASRFVNEREEYNHAKGAFVQRILQCSLLAQEHCW